MKQKIKRFFQTLTIGKANFIFNRGWAWFSKLISVMNFAMLLYLTLQENSLFGWLLPFAFLAWGFVTFLDLVFIYPTETDYSFMKVPVFAQMINDISIIKEDLKGLRK